MAVTFLHQIQQIIRTFLYIQKDKKTVRILFQIRNISLRNVQDIMIKLECKTNKED